MQDGTNNTCESKSRPKSNAPSSPTIHVENEAYFANNTQSICNSNVYLHTLIQPQRRHVRRRRDTIRTTRLPSPRFSAKSKFRRTSATPSRSCISVPSEWHRRRTHGSSSQTITPSKPWPTTKPWSSFIEQYRTKWWTCPASTTYLI